MPLFGFAGAAAIVLGLAACASGYGSSSSATTHAVPRSSPALRLRILTPHVGGHTGTSVSVRMALTGGRLGPRSVRLILDHGRSHRAGARFILRNLAPGRHHLHVDLVSDPRVLADTEFLVRPPRTRPAAQTVPAVSVTSTATTAPAPATSTTTPAPASAPSPAPAPASTTTQAAPPSAGIPQHGGGDGDSDNNGGPSDGDGNV